jgi:hypothetical protein
MKNENEKNETGKITFLYGPVLDIRMLNLIPSNCLLCLGLEETEVPTATILFHCNRRLKLMLTKPAAFLISSEIYTTPQKLTSLEIQILCNNGKVKTISP